MDTMVYTATEKHGTVNTTVEPIHNSNELGIYEVLVCRNHPYVGVPGCSKPI